MNCKNKSTELRSMSSTNDVRSSSTKNYFSQINESHEQDVANENQLSLNRFRVEDILTDVNIRIDRKKFRAHRIILAAQSPYFEALFKSDPSITSIAGNTVLNEIGAKLFEDILNFMYNNATNCINKQNAFHMYKFAHVLDMKVLARKAAQFIKSSSLEVDDEADACELALNWKDMSLVDVICQRLSKPDCFEKLMQERYEDLSYDIFYKIIENSEFSDDDKMDAIVQWVEVDVQRIPLKVQLFQLVNKLQKLNETMYSQPSIQNVQCNKNAKRSRPNDVTGGDGSVLKMSKKSVNLPTTGKSSELEDTHLKIFVQTRFINGDHDIDALSFDDDQWIWTWLSNERSNVICDQLKTIRFNNYDYFLTFQYGRNGGRGKNLFWMVNESGKKDLAAFPIIIKDYRLSVLNNELMLYDVNCTIKNRSLMRYDGALDVWYHIKTPMAWYNAGVTECNGSYYVCGGLNEDSNSNKKAYCYDRRLSTWIDLPEMIHNHDRAVACSHNGKIYLYGINDGRFEVFDTIKWRWRSLRAKTRVETPLFYESEKFFIPSYKSNDVVLVNMDGKITKYNIDFDNWSFLRSFPANKLYERKVTSIRVKDVVQEWR